MRPQDDGPRPGRPDPLAGVPDAVYRLDPHGPVHLPERRRRGAAGAPRPTSCSAARCVDVLPRHARARSLEEQYPRGARRRPTAAVRVLLRAAEPLVRDPRLPRSGRARGLLPRRRRPRTATDQQRDAEMRRAHRRPGGAARRPPSWSTTTAGSSPRTGRGWPTASCSAAPASGPAGWATTTWTAMSRGLRPADHAAIVAGHRPAAGRAATARRPATFDHDYSARLGRARPAGSGCRPPAVEGSAPDRRHPHRHHRAGAQRAGAGLAGRPRRADRAAQPRHAAAT